MDCMRACLALSDRLGTATLYLRPSVISGASGLVRCGHWSRKETVPTTTFDALCERRSLGRVRFVKIDCEGAEGLVVAGSERMIARQAVDVFNGHFHKSTLGPSHRELFSLLQDHGYRACTLNGLWLFATPWAVESLASLGRYGEVDGPPTHVWE